ncbi:MAG: hypothetical protein V3U54_08640 [Thermodesulfobacteriota bacterium]
MIDTERRVFGMFTNGIYDIVGMMYKRRLTGYVAKSHHTGVLSVGERVDLPQYHLEADTKPQFYLKEKK